MELRQFISQALIDIVEGVADAQAKSANSQIVPPTEETLEIVSSGLTPYQSVKFEICVRIDESKGSEGKIGVLSGLIGASMAGKSSNESEHTTSLQFCVPIRFATRNFE